MALILKDRVRETTLSSGTSDVLLSGPVTGFQAFSVLGNGNTTYYCIAGQGTYEWEVGIGTYISSTNTLQRTTVLSNSAATEPALLAFSTGVKDVFVTYPSEKSVNLDASGNVSPLGTVASGTWQASTVTVPYGGTGATTLTGYVKGSGTSALTASSTIPSSDITGLGTMAAQNANSVAITGGTVDGTTIGGSTAATGTFTTVSGTTGNITTVNATTVDTTNIEVTTIKAKDGTAAGSIADTTGVVTLASSVLTTTDINGGTIDGTSIGASSPSTGVFTSLTSTSTTTLNGTTIPASKTLVDTDSSQTLTNKAYNGSIGATTPSTGVFTQVDVDNLRLDSNTLSSTNTNGNITIDPNGTGQVIVDATSAVRIAAGTTAQRPAGAAGDLRFNSTTNEFEGYNGTAWASVGGSAISNDTATSTDLYPLFANATSGTAANVYTSNAKLLYKPSTGELKAQELVATNGIVVNSATVSANYTIPTGSNAMSAGPVSVASGVAVTVSSGSRWVIV